MRFFVNTRSRRRVSVTAGALALVCLTACSTPEVAPTVASETSTASSTASAASSSSSSSSASSSLALTAASTSTESAAEPSSAPVIQTPAPASTAGVLPWGFVTAEDVQKAADLVAGLSVEQKAGSVIMASSADVVDRTTVADLGLGGVILMGRNGVIDGTRDGSPSQVSAVSAAAAGQVAPQFAGFPLLVGVDQEYGDVTRLEYGFTNLPGASDLGQIDDPAVAAQITQDVAAVAGAELAAVGINVDFAPVSDVLPEYGSSSIGDRSYGDDPAAVAALVAAAVRGYQSAGIAATLKHFPGIGELAADTHESLPTINASCAEWNAVASVPLRSGVDAGVGMVMTGHALFPAAGDSTEPTSISPLILADLLRGKGTVDSLGGCQPLAFQGVTISDSLQMVPISGTYSSGDAAWRALAAGQDLLLMPVDPAAAAAGVVSAIGNGSLDPARLDEAAIRVLALRAALGRSVRPGMDVIDSETHQAVANNAWNEIGS